MSAAVERRNPRRYLAWCEDCQDGYQGGKITAEKWADRHNTDRHPAPAEELPWGASCPRGHCHWTTREEGYATRAEAMVALHKHLTADHHEETP